MNVNDFDMLKGRLFGVTKPSRIEGMFVIKPFIVLSGCSCVEYFVVIWIDKRNVLSIDKRLFNSSDEFELVIFEYRNAGFNQSMHVHLFHASYFQTPMRNRIFKGKLTSK
jgi:hypothetical protein